MADDERLEELVARQRVLLDINRAVSANLDRDSLIKAIEAAVSPIIPMDMAVVLLPGPPDSDYEVYATYGISHPAYVAGSIINNRADLVPEVLRSGKMIRFRSISDMVASGGRVDVPQELGIESGLIVPLPGREGSLGAVAFASPEEGRFDHVDLTFVEELADVLAAALANSLTFEENRRLKDQLSAENRYLRDALPEHSRTLVGSSGAMQRLRAQIATVAGTDTAVLICGETGTGKELVANEVHRLSRRGSLPLVKVNCAALAGSLAESELFGHVKGAFTDAKSDRRGRFQAADGGTLFLDEVGELTPRIQATLLRALQQGEIEPVGGSSAHEVDVRVVAATNRDLPAMIAAGTFRSDLYYRLNVLTIDVPPLSERREDIPELIEHLLARANSKLSNRVERFSDEAIAELIERQWPGNVRELQNVIERAVILAKGPVAELAPVVCRVPSRRSGGTLEDVERSHIRQVLGQCNWVVSGGDGAAAMLGLNPSTLRSRMRKLGIVRDQVAEGGE